MNILSFGAGAISTYIGGSLALAGHDVSFVVRSGAEEIKQKGLTLDLTKDQRRKNGKIFHFSRFTVHSSLENAFNKNKFDFALFALKSYDTASALEGIKPLADKMPPLLCLQNGVDNESALGEVLGREKVIHATVTTAVGRSGAGQVALERLRGVGVADESPLARAIVQSMNEAFLNAKLFPHAADMKWSKMLTNLMANPASAILNMSAAEIFANKNLYALEIKVLCECLAVMKAQKINVVDLPGTPVRALALATQLPLWISKPLVSKAAGAGRGNKMPSFHIDLHSGRNKSEVEFLHGAVVRAGEKFNVPTPANKMLTNTLLDLVNKKIPLNMFDHQPEKLLKNL